MRSFAAADLDRLLDFPSLVDAIDAALRRPVEVPQRHHHTVGRAEGAGTLLLMPAWDAGAGGLMGVKVVTVFPHNGTRGLPSVLGSYMLMDGDTGAPLAILDGTRLTLWRTAACSALASRYLSRDDAAVLTMCGAGALAPFLIRAHCAVRPVRTVRLWARDFAKARALAASLAAEGLPVTAAEDRAAAIREADIVSCATLSKTPLVEGAWLRPGTHCDLVGAFRPDMRESDDAAVLRARLFCDTRAGALHEAGDLMQPIAAGLLTADRIEAELSDLARGSVVVARRPEDITLYKSAGGAAFDLAAAALLWRLAGPA